jgi:hypothetical protein
VGPQGPAAVRARPWEIPGEATGPHPCNDTRNTLMRKAPAPEILGNKFGFWTVTQRVDRGKRFSEYECTCHCGTIRVIGRGNLVQGKTKSCGCMRSSKLSQLRTTHGMGGKPRSKIYSAWSSMMTRCFNERSKSWENYGGRGITACKRWESFENFFEDMGDPEPHQSLDRIDPNGNYEPSNCRWADSKTQTRNRRNVKLNEFIVERLREGAVSPMEVMASTGCSPSTAYAARNGQNWRAA